MGNKLSCHCETDKKTIFESHGRKVFRIPALFHERESETFLAFAEQRKTLDDASAEKLVMRTGTLKKTLSDVRTIKWSGITTVDKAHLHGYRPMNPCPLYEKTSKTLFLFFICVKGNTTEQWQINNFVNRTRLCFIKSENLGKSWSDVTDLTDALDEIKSWATFGVGPGHGLQTESGRLIVPTYAYCHSPKSKKTAPYALGLYSDDYGKKWSFGKMLENESLECEMAEFFDETDNSVIYCNARKASGYREEAVCKGGSKDFSKLSRAQKLVETGRGCQGSVVSFPAQREDVHANSDPSQEPNKWLLFTHPSDKASRINLAVYVNKSPGDPNTWSKPWIINRGPSGYSDLAYIGEGWFACLMECGQQKETEKIAFRVFSYSEVKKGIKKKK
ncbi:sialidase-3-like [Enoplosus armatus]|uniref:sialidase-3-like n=1 Tax=Enoplosus armatus TaxID=215367 RepID=UPI0039930DF7